MANKKDETEKKAPAATPSTSMEVLDPEVIGRGEEVKIELRKQSYIAPLQNLVSCIQFDAGQMKKHEQAAGYIKTRIGLALIAAKEMVKPKTFGSWMEANFSGKLSVRSGQICMQIAKTYISSEAAEKLMLPKAEESGSWLVERNEVSPLGSSIYEFIGGRTLGDLYDDCGIKSNKTGGKGGYRPASWLLKNYRAEHKHLENMPFDIWPEAERKKYIEWQDMQTASDNTANKRLAAEQSFEGIRLQVSNHCLTRKTHALIDRDQAQIIYDVLTEAAADIKKVHQL